MIHGDWRTKNWKVYCIPYSYQTPSTNYHSLDHANHAILNYPEPLSVRSASEISHVMHPTYGDEGWFRLAEQMHVRML